MKIDLYADNLKTYTVPFASLIAVLALIPLVIIPQLNMIAQDSQVINKNRDRLNTIEKKAQVLEQQAQQREVLNSQLETAEKVLPLSQSIAPLVLGVQQIAINNNLTVSKIKLQPGKVATDSAKTQTTPVDGTAVQTQTQNDISLQQTSTAIIFEMNVDGNLGSLQSFLQVLEKGRRLLIFKNFKAEVFGANNYHIQIFLAAPYSPLPKISQDQVASELPIISKADDELLEKIGSGLLRDITTSNIAPGPRGVSSPF
jgi:hypothetical protein